MVVEYAGTTMSATAMEMERLEMERPEKQNLSFMFTPAGMLKLVSGGGVGLLSRHLSRCGSYSVKLRLLTRAARLSNRGYCLRRDAVTCTAYSFALARMG